MMPPYFSDYKKISTCILICIFIIMLSSCNESKPSKDLKIVAKVSELNSAVAVQLEELIRAIGDSASDPKIKTYNTLSIQKYFATDCKPMFTNNAKLSDAGVRLKEFLESDCKYYGLFPEAYHQKAIQKLWSEAQSDSSKKLNAVEWAKLELLMTDAFFQINKHIKNGRLYVDTNYKYLDTSFTKNILIPNLNKFVENPDSLDNYLHTLEPNLHDYDSLKLYLKHNLTSIESGTKQYTKLIYPTKDSAKFVQAFILRLQEEGIATNTTSLVDSMALVDIIKTYQQKYGIVPTGKFSKDFIDGMNIKNESKFIKIAIALDKFKNIKIPNNGNYVIVNIPAYTLRAYNADSMVMESRVAVGKTSSKTPEMESEISDIIVMPRWFVPPSILKIPGYIERHRNNPNYIVRGKSVVQKSGPGNALGKMKFNFRSGDAIYLHDTNDKGAFGSNWRAVSHGCVRVQNYVQLASFISSVSPIVEKNYKKVVSTFTVDSVSKDTVFKYKYVAKDSVIHTTDIIPNMVKNNAHHELEVAKKVPIYIKYHTCAIRNGVLVFYNDVYGFDKILQQKYFSNYL
jgi:L,D-transpeptidase YcbB